MKSNFFKYIFIIFVIAIVTYAIYILYFKEDNNGEILNGEEVSNDQSIQITNLRFAISNFDNINPLISNNKEVLNIDKIIFEPLVTVTEDYRLQMVLASECSKISDTIYVLKLDTSKKWHNGSFVTAKDVAFTINKLKEGKSVYSHNVEKVLNTEIIDASTIKINLIEPVIFFEYNLTFPIMSNNYYLYEDFYESTKVPIGTGMFYISEITDNNIKLERNEKWWNKDELPKVDTINIKICNQIGEVYNSFKMKNIDIFTTYNTSLEDYIGTMGYYKQEVKGREFNYLALNTQNKILKYKEVRQALNYSIDKTNIVSSAFNNNAYISKYPLDYGSYLYSDEALNSNYNIEQAKKVLTDNGWEYKNNSWQKKDGYSTLRINLKLTVNSSDEEKVKVAENIKNQLEQIGIKVSLNKVSDTRYQEILVNKNYEMILTGVYNPFSPNLESYFGNNNLQNYNNEEATKILSEVKNIQDENLLKEKYNRLEQIYNEDMPFVSLYRNKFYVVKSQNLVGELIANNFFSYYRIFGWYRI